MTQGAWISPRLKRTNLPRKKMGIFGNQLLQYLGYYKIEVTRNLCNLLNSFDFSGIPARIISSSPIYRYIPLDKKSEDATRDHFLTTDNRVGLNALRKEVCKIPKDEEKDWDKDEIIMQMSSIGQLGNTPTFLHDMVFRALYGKDFVSLSKTATTSGQSKLNFGSKNNKSNQCEPKSKSLTKSDLDRIKLIWPTISNVKDSVTGYMAGIALHMKLEGKQNMHQLDHLKPHLRVWRSLDAGRERVMPHVKTYLRINDRHDDIRWLLLTSANLSKSAWGLLSADSGKNAKSTKPTNANTLKIKMENWEAGVLIHPLLYLKPREITGIEFPLDSEEDIISDEKFLDSKLSNMGDEELKALYKANKRKVAMIPVFKRDFLTKKEADEYRKKHGLDPDAKLVCIRMFYDVPTQAYNWKGDIPWSSGCNPPEKDWMGQKWPMS